MSRPIARSVNLTIPLEPGAAKLLQNGARHAGDDHAILAARHALYTQARDMNPAHWSGATRNWSPIGAVTLNPEHDSIVKAHSEHIDKQLLAA